ncbi:MAG: DUF2062 domain-containing protein [Smithellaceae bacterium]|nr:DUF2062 domain-containing protein [Smithellaceae bacterium]
MNLKKWFMAFYRRFISLRGDPKAIALGMALGIFVGVTPTIPFHTVLIVIFSVAFRLNITSAYLGSWLISNPVTIPLFYVSEYHLGKLLMGDGAMTITLPDYSIYTILQKGSDIAVPLLLGGFLLAPLFAIPAYFITHRLVVYVREKGLHEKHQNDSEGA